MNMSNGKIVGIEKESETEIVYNIEITSKNGLIRGYYRFPKDTLFPPCCILVHGSNNSLKNEAGCSSRLAKQGIASIYFCFCGSGENSISEANIETADLVTEVEDLQTVLAFAKSLPEIDTTKISLMGRSLGGIIAEKVANDNPDDIEMLFLIQPANIAIYDSLSGKSQRGIGSTKQFLDSAKKFKLPKGFPNSTNVEEENDILNYTGPVNIYMGDSDSVVPIEEIIWLNENYENSYLKIFGEEGHSFSEPTKDIMIEEVAQKIHNIHTHKI